MREIFSLLLFLKLRDLNLKTGGALQTKLYKTAHERQIEKEKKIPEQNLKDLCLNMFLHEYH